MAGEIMAGTYNRCADCNKLRKRHMALGDKKLCIDCYEEYAGDAWLQEYRENE